MPSHLVPLHPDLLKPYSGSPALDPIRVQPQALEESRVHLPPILSSQGDPAHADSRTVNLPSVVDVFDSTQSGRRLNKLLKLLVPTVGGEATESQIKTKVTWRFKSEDGTIGNGWWLRTVTVPKEQGQSGVHELSAGSFASRVVTCKSRLSCPFCFSEGSSTPYGCAIALISPAGPIDGVILKHSTPYQLRATRALLYSAGLTARSSPVHSMSGDSGGTYETQRVQLKTLGTPLTLSYQEATLVSSGRRFVEMKICGDVRVPGMQAFQSRDLIRLGTGSHGSYVEIFYKDPPALVPQYEIPLIHSAILYSIQSTA